MREIMPRMKRVGLIFDTTISHNYKLIKESAGEAARATGASMPPKRLSRVIQQMRESKGLTQRDLAARAKVTPGYIAQIELGKKKNPSLDVLKRIAKALGVPVTELLE
jgi:DNA-binding XRE family transcriptional regulator